jgi:hypothetical protein
LNFIESVNASCGFAFADCISSSSLSFDWKKFKRRQAEACPTGMRIREYTVADFDELRRLHATQGFGYPLPDLDSPLFVSKLVLEDDAEDNSAIASGSTRATGTCAETLGRAEKPKIAMAVLLRLTAEGYLLHDPAAGTPRLRWQNFLALHDAARASAGARGLDDVQAFLPPRVARAFGRRLSRLGWTRDPWDCFSQRL